MKSNAPLSFKLYTDIRPMLNIVPQKDGLPLLKAIFDYVLGEDVPTFKNASTAAVWETIRQKLDIGIEKSRQLSETNRQNVNKRWEKEGSKEYDRIRSNTAEYDRKDSYTNAPTIQEHLQVRNGDETIQDSSPVPGLNKNNTDGAAGFDSVGAGPAGSAAADAAPRPAPDADLFTLAQIKACIKRNKIDLTADGAEAFLEEMQESGWILYGKPVEKRTIARSLRGWAKYHGEYSAQAEEEEHAERIRRAKEAAQKLQPVKKSKDEEVAEIGQKYVPAEYWERYPGAHRILIGAFCPKDAFLNADRKDLLDHLNKNGIYLVNKPKGTESQYFESITGEKIKVSTESGGAKGKSFTEHLKETKKHAGKTGEGIPAELLRLMQRDHIPEYAVMALVSSKGYFPETTPIAEYPDDFVSGWCVGYWDQVRDSIRDYAEAAGVELSAEVQA